ncbi:DUF7146 domain-containing protein [Pseudogemmobacter bohemicus]|uniref:DUF7146 domain-containing protein n=1 Tax=Pseudogemmobacter bohemicus TaxID=2250708 RepID=UPI000DD4494B|nr:toprim domain-containing protein [Pseudogemmobacter bohemicus]
MSYEPRQQVSIETIKDRLLAQIDSVVSRYAPEAPGAFHKGSLYFTLNPGRVDNNVGSFCIHMSGPDAGRWVDFACAPAGSGRGKYLTGDLIDLIGMSLGLTHARDALAEARRFLGLETEDPATRRQREEHAARLKREREAQVVDRAAQLLKKQKKAEALWLSGQRELRGSPVDLYLKGRGIDLSLLGHAPGAIRYHPECFYVPDVREEHVDPDSGEVSFRRVKGKAVRMPAMLTAIALKGRIIDCHRTYLALGERGWVKADLPDAKKVFSDYTGGSIRLCNGLGPRGGRGAALSQCPPGTRVFIAEGIENGLSGVMLRHLAGLDPERVIAAGSIWNLGEVELPANVSEVILAADNDQGAQAQAQLAEAVAKHKRAGRVVRVWKSRIPGEDLNDALRRVLKEMEGVA